MTDDQTLEMVRIFVTYCQNANRVLPVMEDSNIAGCFFKKDFISLYCIL